MVRRREFGFGSDLRNFKDLWFGFNLCLPGRFQPADFERQSHRKSPVVAATCVAIPAQDHV